MSVGSFTQWEFWLIRSGNYLHYKYINYQLRLPDHSKILLKKQTTGFFLESTLRKDIVGTWKHTCVHAHPRYNFYKYTHLYLCVEFFTYYKLYYVAYYQITSIYFTNCLYSSHFAAATYILKLSSKECKNATKPITTLDECNQQINCANR